MRMNRLLFTAAALGALALAAPGVARAEDPATMDRGPRQAKVVHGPRGPKIIFEKPGIIYGVVPRPRAFYVLERSRRAATVTSSPCASKMRL